MWTTYAWRLRLKHGIERCWVHSFAPEHRGDASWTKLLGNEAAMEATGR